MPDRPRKRSDSSPGMVKVLFDLEQDESGFPPQTRETLWATPVEDGYRLENVPFFAQGVAFGDVVTGSGTEDDEPVAYGAVLTPSGHSTCRVVLVDEDEDVQAARRTLEGLGCDTELSHLDRYFAVDVPPEVSMDEVLAVLKEGQDEGRWEFDVGVFGDR